MLHPSYSELMKVVNQDVEEGATKVVNSRYSIVLATAKRARQIVSGDCEQTGREGTVDCGRRVESSRTQDCS